MICNCCEWALPLIALLALVAGCRPTPCRQLSVVVSGDTAGWIAPCGCSSNQSGGLARRATYLKELRQERAVIAADVGGAVRGDSPYDRLKLDTILSGERLIGTAAHNIGAAEAQFGPDHLRRLASVGVPLLSANVRDRSGRPVGEPLRIVVAEGRRIALVGVLSERYATPALDVAPPRQAVLDALRAASERYDAVIVLAYVPEDELRLLAAGLPEVDAIVGGPTGQPLAPRRMGPTLLASATNEGKFLVRLDAPDAGQSDAWSGLIAELTERFADDPEQTVNLAEFRKSLAREDFSPRQTSFVEPLPRDLPKGFAVAGTASCQTCHEEESRRWRQSRHAAAWASLKKTGSQADPACQRCHTTGYGAPGGFSSIKDERPLRDRVQVGCESCHGPSQGHTAEPAVHTSYFARAKDLCTGCHDRENSPKFDYDKYWKLIMHGKKP